ncbi:beta-lactamase family protein [Reticulibacter mediterranei]|uniref:beta-lactamase family protein n=1 Tax=Reticulibacter mediterranei TaxID=2778369 RepID=UPI001F49025E|nr:beta-lactamase family protein [Reticulibacter mediterranei]
MYTPVQLEDGSTTEYGFGWGIGDYCGHRMAYHQGAINGFITFLARFLDDAVTVILLSNANGRDIETLFRRIVRQVLEIPPLNQEMCALSPSTLRRMTGTYVLGKLFKYVVEQRETRIILLPSNVELLPIQKTRWCFAHDHEIEVYFTDQEGQSLSHHDDSLSLLPIDPDARERRAVSRTFLGAGTLHF